ncbi:HAMP domain-containing sensor histidine kinase [Polymorphobacter fuscus]|uniref:histidine kinase n=1 Tax=Sandarakinorhabdus fusca TaxID=1439888 RepID=A0A7C9GQR9_9SPHN|nr:HAMP domain-containing sensor histidine kinase [Polymorphobacter fuscus]KAB7643874.1 HAMP domain-containing histidine kinase [Polymorphobacter fuscus]MQT18575.1 sensor histidine kinase [Polymorphobacter fuscus]NJC07058.1 signal transduction histidine kinase [Polymorphobacter fuscus]
MPEHSGSGPSLFRQIARRLVVFTLIFALLDIFIVIATYARHPESLTQELLTLEAERIAPLADPASADPAPGTRNWSARLVGPRADGDATLIDWTRRDRIDGGYRISGMRPVGDDTASHWLLIRFDTVGMRPFVPVILDELVEHVALPLVPLSALLLLFNVISVRRVLAPLQRAEAEVDSLAPDNMAMRLTVPGEPREVDTLVRAVNRALARLETAIVTLRDFTANAAHELRTPLAIMQLSLERLPDGAIKADLQADTDQMTRLVGQMLDLAQADALVVADPVPVDLAALGRAVVTQLSPGAFAAGRELRFVDQGGAIIQGHAEAIFRLYRNLVDNALAHAPGTTPIDVTAGPGPQMSVRDHGPGIAAADLPHLFERFWRKDRSGTGGAGLGLGIVRRLVDAHGGSITVESPAGGGALFRVRFPAA